MAEVKNTHREEHKIYHQPWYKERLRTKYIKSLGPNDTSQFFNGKNWIFLKDGLDDFRDGLPPETEGDIILQGSKGLSPNIQGSSDDLSSIKQPATRNRFSKDETCFSNVTPLQQQRREHIEEVEYGLTQHPLALYPHLEECLPPDVFEDVVDILDPEMNLPSEDGDEYYEEDETQSPSASLLHPPKETTENADQPVRNPYRWLPRKEEKESKDKKTAAERRTLSPSQDEHINQVTNEFCDWVTSLGGETNNIEESTITSLFASGYETKPALSVPIHVVELTNVPPELRMSAAVPPTQPQHPKVTEGAANAKQKGWRHSGGYEPSWVKFNYGAWYLDPKGWTPRQADKPLQDPKEIKNQEMSEAKKKSNALDYDLAPMHGAKSFMEFIDRKNSSHRPEFLNRVAKIQEEQARDDELRMEADLAKQRKSHNVRSRVDSFTR